MGRTNEWLADYIDEMPRSRETIPEQIEKHALKEHQVRAKAGRPKETKFKIGIRKLFEGLMVQRLEEYRRSLKSATSS